MPLLGFRPRFAAPILDGSKRQTIRRPRRDGRVHAKPDDALHLYTGLRTKNARKLGIARCLGVDEVRMNFLRDRVTVTHALGVRPILSHLELDEFAQADGFAHWADMKATFAEIHGGDLVEFTGAIIRWGELQ
jgi:hypothetical protein